MTKKRISWLDGRNGLVAHNVPLFMACVLIIYIYSDYSSCVVCHTEADHKSLFRLSAPPYQQLVGALTHTYSPTQNVESGWTEGTEGHKCVDLYLSFPAANRYSYFMCALGLFLCFDFTHSTFRPTNDFQFVFVCRVHCEYTGGRIIANSIYFSTGIIQMNFFVSFPSV